VRTRVEPRLTEEEEGGGDEKLRGLGRLSRTCGLGWRRNRRRDAWGIYFFEARLMMMMSMSMELLLIGITDDGERGDEDDEFLKVL
jgi:hypothetical protein